MLTLTPTTMSVEIHGHTTEFDAMLDSMESLPDEDRLSMEADIFLRLYAQAKKKESELRGNCL